MNKRLLLAIFVVFFLLSGNTAYSIPAFPDPLANAVQYGDFYSYSLPLLDYWTDFNGYKSGDLWHVNLAQPKDNPIVVYTNANNVKDNPPGMDDAFDSATGNSVVNFGMDAGNEPSPVLPYDKTGYWDTELGALIDHLNGNELVFFFNNSQHQNIGEDGFPQDHLFGWGQVIIEDVEGVLDDLIFDFINTNTSNNTSLYTHVGPLGPINAYTGYNTPGDYVLSGGDLYLDENTFAVEPFDPNSNQIKLPHNLGFNEAAYALVSPEINDGLIGWKALGYDYMRIDMRLEHLNDGPEQLFILQNPRVPQTPIPEPASIILFGFGLVGLAGVARKKMKK
jgi:hypothetical protein